MSEPDEHARVAIEGGYRTVVDKLDDSVLITDARIDSPGPTIVYVNRAFTRMTGYEAREVIGSTPRILQGPETDRTVLDRLRVCMKHGRRFEGETVNYRKDGSPYIVNWYIEPLLDADGAPTRFMAVQRDVTAIRKSERQRVRLEAALLRFPHAVIMFDATGKIVFVNPACKLIARRSAAMLLGRPIWRSPLIPDARETLADIRSHVTSARTWRGEMALTIGTRDPRLMQTTIVPVLGDDGVARPDCFVAIGIDVTRDRRLESIAAAHNFADSVGYVFSGIRHELGNPINSIKAAISLLRARAEEMEPRRMARYLERVLDEIGRVEYLLDSLRSFNMFQSPKPEPVAIDSFFEPFLRLIRNDLKKRGIEVLFEAPSDPLSVEADPRALNQVLLNLVSNAVDALESVPKPWLRIRIHARGDNAEISVSDNGCGIARENLDDIFKPFYTSKQGGTGLGLAISRKLLSQMGGVITVASRLGRGTTFSIQFERSQDAS